MAVNWQRDVEKLYFMTVGGIEIWVGTSVAGYHYAFPGVACDRVRWSPRFGTSNEAIHAALSDRDRMLDELKALDESC